MSAAAPVPHPAPGAPGPATVAGPLATALGLGLPDAEREAAYSPSRCIGGDYRPFVQAYADQSHRARQQAAGLGARHAVLPLPGQGTAHVELWCPPGPAPAAGWPLLLYLHGGYWQELSAAQSCFAAAAWLPRGAAFAALEYTLAPAITVAGIVQQCRQAYAMLVQQAARWGLDPTRLVVAGSSAGAHLAAMVGLAGWRQAQGLPPPAGLLLVSGVYWLAPLVGTGINQALGLTPADAAALSPALQPLAGFASPGVVCVGEIETPAFHAQSQAFAALLAGAGLAAPSFQVPARHHFDIILDLADPATLLGRHTAACLGLG